MAGLTLSWKIGTVMNNENASLTLCGDGDIVEGAGGEPGADNRGVREQN